MTWHHETIRASKPLSKIHALFCGKAQALNVGTIFAYGAVQNAVVTYHYSLLLSVLC